MTKPFLGYESHSFPGRRLKTSRLVTWKAGGDIKTGWRIPVFPGFMLLCTAFHYFIFPLGMRLFISRPQCTSLLQKHTQVVLWIDSGCDAWSQVHDSPSEGRAVMTSCLSTYLISGTSTFSLISSPTHQTFINTWRLASMLLEKRRKWGKVKLHLKGGL